MTAVSSSPLQIALQRMLRLPTKEYRALLPVRLDGEQAFHKNQGMGANPYPPETNEWAAWLTGWDAERERQS